ncbi:MAG: chemotaxis protein MotB [Saprospiraceae bacterium]|jgi:chemotaxis protein MotB
MINKNIWILGIIMVMLSSCAAGKKEIASLQERINLADRDLSVVNSQLNECREETNAYIAQLAKSNKNREKLQVDLSAARNTVVLREEQVQDLRAQVQQQTTTVGDLTVLSQSANENIKETLSQMESRDQYIHLLQAAKTKADSINLALAINLKGVLAQGVADQDIDIQVDKTVVFVNLSDKMLFQSGSTLLTPRANDVLGKIAKIVESRPDLEVMVEGYTDNVPIQSACMNDNWDLSVKRATSVIRVLQNNYGVDPNRLIAAGRGEYNALASNDTQDGRSMNRRTRIIILPKLNQFYDLLNPDKVGGGK